MCREDRQERIAGEVARTANTIHHLGTQYVGRIDITEDVGLEGCVEGNDAQSTDALGMVGDLLRTQNDTFAENVHIGVHLIHVVIGQTQRRTGSTKAAALHNEVDG